MTDEEVSEAISLLEQRIDKEMRYSHVDCSKGWHRLIIECDRELLSLDPNYTPVQIKQKFGGLRFYFDTDTDRETSDAMRLVVKKYEELSLQTCELTGEAGVLMYCRGYYQTIKPELAPEGSKKVDDNGI